MAMTLSDNYKKCNQITETFLDMIKQIDPSLKVVVIIENPANSILKSSDPDNFTEALGLLEVSKIRLAEMEKQSFYKRIAGMEVIERFEGENVISIDKEKLN